MIIYKRTQSSKIKRNIMSRPHGTQVLFVFVLLYANTTPAKAQTDDCISCDAGKYAAAVGMAQCSLCVKGKYRQGTGGSAENQCLLCGAGKYSTIEASTTPDTCQNCAAGTFMWTHVNFSDFLITMSQQNSTVHTLLEQCVYNATILDLDSGENAIMLKTPDSYVYFVLFAEHSSSNAREISVREILSSTSTRYNLGDVVQIHASSTRVHNPFVLRFTDDITARWSPANIDPKHYSTNKYQVFSQIES